jgi:serine/threonine protein kinase
MLRTVDSDRVEVSGLAGEGGMSLVYRGVDRTTGRQVAIKILREGLSIGDRFERESRLLAELERPARGRLRGARHCRDQGRAK